MNNPSQNSCLSFITSLKDLYQNTPVFWDLKKDRHIGFREFYKELLVRADDLREIGLTKKRVLVIAESSYDMILQCLALHLADNSVAIMPSDVQLLGVDKSLNAWNAEYCIASSQPECGFEELTPFGVTSTFSIWKTKISTDEVHFSESNVIFLTSGSTGEPKLVRHRTSSTFVMASRAAAILSHLPLGSRTILVLPLHHIYGYVNVLLTSMSMGVEVAIGEGVRTLVRDLAKVKPTCLFCVPSLMTSLYNYYNRISPDKRLSEFLGGRITAILCGGGPIDKYTSSAILENGIYLANGYGSTETCGCIALSLNEDAIEGKFNRIVDGVDIAIGKHGNIRVHSDCNMISYVGDTKLQILNGRSWFDTQDRGYIDDSSIKLEGRMDQLLSLPNGEKAFTGDIRNSLLKISGVSTITAQPDSDGLKVKLVVDIDGVEIRDIIKTEILTLNRSLPSYMRIVNYDIERR